MEQRPRDPQDEPILRALSTIRTAAYVLRDIDFLDDAGYIGGDSNFVGLDIGVLGRHHPAAGDIPIAAGA